jgi:hypothetical protein
LYEFSQQNNNEMGIYISKAEDPDLYNDTLKEAQRLLTISEEIRVPVKKFTVEPPVEIAVKKNEASNVGVKAFGKPNGYCLRTGLSIPFNVEKPMTNDAFKSWNKFGNADYPEKFCHFSGEQSNGETSVGRPILKKNWKKAKEIFGMK